MFLECRHIKTDGKRCRAAALKGKPYCFFHMRPGRMPRKKSIAIPPVEDSSSILLAIAEVFRALNDKTISNKRAGLLLYGLQIAASAALEKERIASTFADTLRSIHNLSAEPLEFSEASNTATPMLAPENSICEPPHACARCNSKTICREREDLHQKSIGR